MPSATPVTAYRVTTDPVLLAAGIWLARNRAAAGHYRESAARTSRMSMVTLTSLEVGSSWLSETHFRAYLAAAHLEPPAVTGVLALREDALRTPAERRKAATVTARQKGVFDGYDSWRERVAALDGAADDVTIPSTRPVVPDLLNPADYRHALRQGGIPCSGGRKLPPRAMARSTAYISVQALESPFSPGRESNRVMADQILYLQDLTRSGSGLRLRLLPAQAPVPAGQFVTEHRVRLPEHKTGGRLIACGERPGAGAYFYTRAEYRTVTDLIEAADQAALSVEDSTAYLTRRLAELLPAPRAAHASAAAAGGRSKAGTDTSRRPASATRPRNRTKTQRTPMADSVGPLPDQSTESR